MKYTEMNDTIYTSNFSGGKINWNHIETMVAVVMVAAQIPAAEISAI